jgi:hypothetical protein
MRVWRIFALSALPPSDTQREPVRWAAMPGYDTKNDTNSGVPSDPHKFVTRCPECPSQREPSELQPHFPRHPLSLSAKVRLYLLPLPYRPQGKCSLSRFVIFRCLLAVFVTAGLTRYRACRSA